LILLLLLLPWRLMVKPVKGLPRVVMMLATWILMIQVDKSWYVILKDARRLVAVMRRTTNANSFKTLEDNREHL
jgi:hypothetical protein